MNTHMPFNHKSFVLAGAMALVLLGVGCAPEPQNRNEVSDVNTLPQQDLQTPPAQPDNRDPEGPSDGVACTLEAKQCPDGSYVGRTGPNCEFAPCPGK